MWEWTRWWFKIGWVCVTDYSSNCGGVKDETGRVWGYKQVWYDNQTHKRRSVYGWR
jgi:hypothetical protein